MNRFNRPSRVQLHAYLLLAAVLALVSMAAFAPGSAVAAGPTPVTLEFNGSDDASTLTNFLSTSLLNTKAPNSGATVNTAGSGTLQIVSSGGDLTPFGTDQDNALSVAPFDSSGFYMIGARLLKPVFTAPYQSAGIYIGKANNQYVRFTVGRGSKGSTGDRLELDVLESNGKLRSSVIPLPPGMLASIQTSLDLFLKVEQGGSGKLTALYRIDSDDPNAGQLATSRNFPRWLRQGNPTVFAGVITTNRGTLSSITASYDWFHMTTDPNAPQVVASVTGTKTVDKDGISGPTVNPGDTLTYTINVTNNSTSTTNVQIADPIPVDTTYVDATVVTTYIGGTAGANATYDAANSQIVLPSTVLASKASVQITYQVKINAAPLQSSTIVNSAQLTYGASPTPAYLIASTIVGATPDLSDSIYVANPPAIGLNGTVTYTFTLVNNGTAPANGATVQLSVPSGTTLVANSATASSGTISVDSSLSALNWTAAGPLAINGTATMSFAVQAGSGLTNGATLSSNAIAQATGTLPNIFTAQSLYSVVTTVSGSKTVDKAHASPGAALQYQITVTNSSGAPASNLQVVDPIPQDTTYNANISATPGAATPSYDGANQQVVWSIPTLAANQSITMTFQVLINQLPLHSALITNKATLSVPNAPQTLLSASTIVDGVADLTNSLYTANPTTVGPNGTITYTLDLLNNGTTAATNATAELTIPGGATYVPNSAVASSGSLNVDTGLSKITWTAGGPLPIGSVTHITFQAKLDSTTANSIFSSTATMQAAGTIANSASAQAVLVQSAPSGTKLYMPIIAN